MESGRPAVRVRDKETGRTDVDGYIPPLVWCASVGSDAFDEESVKVRMRMKSLKYLGAKRV